MSKIKKAIFKPHLFLRDYLNKKFPVKYSELNCDMREMVGTKSALASIESIDNKFGNHFPVDAVFTWVDSSDPKWLLKFNKYKLINNYNISPGAVDQARFEDHNELYYSVCSVIKNLNWIRNIFIVTDGQKPRWLKSISGSLREKIRVIDHADIIDSENLPTFNSHVIESNLYKIKGLSDNFIYFNDDVYVASTLNQSHFFKYNGIASVFVSNKTLLEVSSKRVTATTLACGNSIELLDKFYGIRPTYLLQHTYIPLKKEMFIYANRIFCNEINSFQVNKFRSKNDINVATYLIPWMMYVEGVAQISRDICSYFNWRSNDGRAKMELLLAWKKEGFRPDSICSNDFIKTSTDNCSYFSKFLNEYFTEK